MIGQKELVLLEHKFLRLLFREGGHLLGRKSLPQQSLLVEWDCPTVDNDVRELLSYSPLILDLPVHVVPVRVPLSYVPDFKKKNVKLIVT